LLVEALPLAADRAGKARIITAAAPLPGALERLAERGSAVIELTRERFVNDPATGDLLYPLRALVNERLAKAPRDAGLLEMRAELAGQWSDAQAQVADYTAAIQSLAQQTLEATTVELERLYGRRGNAHVTLRQWQHAVDDYAHVVTDTTTDEELLTNRARAYEALRNWEAAAADWPRAVSGNPDGAGLLGEFARRLALAGQFRLAKAQFEKSQALYERMLDADADNDLVAAELARLLSDREANENRTRWAVLKPSEMNW
jgi:tetratricopeptide (TPR) repeat protein